MPVACRRCCYWPFLPMALLVACLVRPRATSDSPKLELELRLAEHLSRRSSQPAHWQAPSHGATRPTGSAPSLASGRSAPLLYPCSRALAPSLPLISCPPSILPILPRCYPHPDRRGTPGHDSERARKHATSAHLPMATPASKQPRTVTMKASLRIAKMCCGEGAIGRAPRCMRGRKDGSLCTHAKRCARAREGRRDAACSTPRAAC